MIVGLFRAPLDLAAADLGALAATLSAEELARADALQDPRARSRWIADHGWRRRLLARRLSDPHASVAPSQLAFADNGHGKPGLIGGRPWFSASRSEDVAWYAVCDRAEVGVDVERIARDRPLRRLAQRLLSPRERELYEAIPEAGRPDALYACWACKEAAVKALGSGLVFPLTGLEAWSDDGAPVRAAGLEIHALAAGPGRAAAVAVRVEAHDAVEIAPVVDLAGR